MMLLIIVSDNWLMFIQKRGLKQLKDAGIAVILDHHALPGVASPGQMFAGRYIYDYFLRI